MKIQPCVLLCCLIMGACGTKHERDEKTLKQAAEIHNEMIKSAHILEERLEDYGRDSLNNALTDSVKVWKKYLDTWEEDVVEVPGNKDHHDHEGGHHHHDHQQVKVTPNQMLAIQQELKKRLDQLHQRMSIVRSSQLDDRERN
ncbi:hypothetical protein V6R21_24960 [Limibacter armeniacum]|uniref:hypothetical protein n=1 Tax=Limibacter armeniacum TaxID=466084 RepID=UPI002FE55D83